MRANDVYCATVMWPRPSLGLPWGLPCPVPTPEALSTVLAWCTRRPSKVRTLVIHIIEFLLYTIAFSLALQSTRVSSSWLRGGLVLDPTERRYPPFIRVNASINRHKPRNSNPFTTEDPIVVLGSDDLSLIPFAISITLWRQALCFLRTLIPRARALRPSACLFTDLSLPPTSGQAKPDQRDSLCKGSAKSPNHLSFDYSPFKLITFPRSTSACPIPFHRCQGSCRSPGQINIMHGPLTVIHNPSSIIRRVVDGREEGV